MRDLQSFETLFVENKKTISRKLADQRLEHLFIPNATAVENNALLLASHNKSAQRIAAFLLGWQVWKGGISPRPVNEQGPDISSDALDGQMRRQARIEPEVASVDGGATSHWVVQDDYR
jgi:hypothetical protein